jgi:hypothetical protein
MAKKTKHKSPKISKKVILKEIEVKLAETVKGYHRKTSEKKFKKTLHKAGKILSRSLTKEQITVVHKEKVKAPKKVKAEPQNVTAGE